MCLAILCDNCCSCRMRLCDCTIDQPFTLNAFGVNRQWLESTNTKYSCFYYEQAQFDSSAVKTGCSLRLQVSLGLGQHALWTSHQVCYSTRYGVCSIVRTSNSSPVASCSWVGISGSCRVAVTSALWQGLCVRCFWLFVGCPVLGAHWRRRYSNSSGLDHCRVSA